jgi:hypothetical protein
MYPIERMTWRPAVLVAGRAVEVEAGGVDGAQPAATINNRERKKARVSVRLIERFIMIDSFLL